MNERTSFHLKGEEFMNIPRLFEVEALAQDESEEQRLRSENQEAMVQFLESNALTGALIVSASYTAGSGWKKKVALSTRWRMYGKDGNLTAEITTYYLADKAEEVCINTLDSRYEETFLKLTKASAESFIETLIGDN